MNVKLYVRVTATLLAIVALAHVTRLVNGWPVEVNGVVIPMAVSWMGTLVPGGLAVWGFRGG